MLKKYLSLILLVQLSSVFSQNLKEVDSINKIILSSDVDSIKAKNHLAIARILMYKNSEQTIKNINAADSLYSSYSDLKELAKLYSLKGEYLYSQGTYDYRITKQAWLRHHSCPVHTRKNTARSNVQ